MVLDIGEQLSHSCHVILTEILQNERGEIRLRNDRMHRVTN
jgi:hypothetical protein